MDEIKELMAKVNQCDIIISLIRTKPNKNVDYKIKILKNTYNG